MYNTSQTLDEGMAFSMGDIVNIYRTSLTFIFALSLLTTANAADCDGNFQVSGPLNCGRALTHEYQDKLISLFEYGLLNKSTQAIRGSCECSAQGRFIYCSASFQVHQCFLGASGTIWFSADPEAMSASFGSWDTASEDPTDDLYGHNAKVATRAAESLIERVKSRAR